ncbi:uncharacterized protein LOC124263708 [Haliotis rubra]|uniref:uncharacterized protein LOC124263708 n=1 Tax=Haliotis rubra TaxID=36100 RepID=UPI001EE57B2A|nr:uncharacterized protein LOC124263708 [Haliotis rubra]
MDFWDFRGWTRIPQNRGLKEPLVLTPHLMRHVYKHMKFLLIFRNPIDRLYSDYFFMNYGHSPESFHDHVILSIRMMENCIRDNSLRTCMFSWKMYYQLPTRLHIGCYSVFLKEWLAVFPREDFLILKTEDYNRDALGTLRDVFNFLLLPPLNEMAMDNLTDLKRRHETKSKKRLVTLLCGDMEDCNISVVPPRNGRRRGKHIMDASIPKKRKRNFSTADIDIIVSGVESNFETLISSLTNTVTNNVKKKIWNDITTKLNATGDITRNEEEVRKKWTDMKACAKKSESARRLNAKRTGGGPPPDDLTVMEKRILNRKCSSHQ